MFRYGPLHAAGEFDPDDGRRYAVTIFRQSEHGVLLIAGKLRQLSSDKPGNEITRGDYQSGQRVSFGNWRDVWEYFAGPPYGPLLKTLRDRIAQFDDLQTPR